MTEVTGTIRFTFGVKPSGTGMWLVMLDNGTITVAICYGGQIINGVDSAAVIACADDYIHFDAENMAEIIRRTGGDNGRA